MAEDQDRQILIKIAEGDAKSFAALFEKYQNLVYGYSMKMLKNKQKAEDNAQETWIRVARNAEKYQPTGSVKSWIMSITRNLVVDEFRAAKKWIDLPDEDWNQIADVQEDLESFCYQQQKQDQFKAAFDELPENQKIILSMVLVEELAQVDVAAKLNISVGAVKASLFRARENLKKKVEGL